MFKEGLHGMSTRESDNFQAELITRFFNPQSYFYQCLSSELRAKEVEPENSYLVGRVVDELVNAEDKLEKLEEFSSIDGFKEFRGYLNQEVERLKLSQLTAEEMMISIKAMAQKMAEMLMKLAKDADGKRVLQKHLGIEVDRRSAPAGQAVAEKKPPSSSEPELASEPKKEAEKKERVSASPAKGKKSDYPWRDLLTNINDHLKEIEDYLSQVKKLSVNRKAANKLLDSFQDLKDSAMISGMEEVEAISSKVIEVSKALRRANCQAWLNQYLSVVNEAVKTIADLNSSTDSSRHQSLKNVDTVMRVLHQLETLKNKIVEEPQGPCPPARPGAREEPEGVSSEMRPRGGEEAVSPEEVAVEEKSVPEEETIEKSEAVSGEAEVKVVEPVTAQINEEHEPYLEEDEELLSQIRELISEDDLNQTIEKPPLASGQAGEEALESVEDIPDLVEIRHDVGSNIRADEEEVVIRDNEISQRFGSEANFYFPVIDKALHNLSKDLTEKSALEDLELACYSLKILAKKLGLEKIGELLGTIEATATHAASGKLILTQQILGFITEAMSLIRNLPNQTATDLKDTIENLSLQLKNELRKDMREMQKPHSHSEDPLDFLMVEDSEDFISKLLDENQRT